MKKVFLIALAISMVFIFVVGGAFVFNNDKYEKNDLLISYSDVNNRYNNMLANVSTDVVQIDDKIFYYCTFGGDPLNYGLYEIQSGSTKRVFWDGLTYYPKGFDLNCVYKNRILKDAESNTYFNTETYKFENGTEQIKGIEDYFDYVSFIKDDIRYFVSEYELVQYDDKNEKFCVLANTDEMQMKDFYLNVLQNFYLTESRIIYQTKIDGKTHICCYDYISRRILYKCSLADIPHSENGVSCIFATDYKVFFVSNQTLYGLDPSKSKLEKLFICDKSFCVNCFEDIVILGVGSGSDKQGVYVIDLKMPAEVRQICEISVDGIYILDNEFVYFTDEDYHLCRVLLDGKKLEYVFDK